MSQILDWFDEPYVAEGSCWACVYHGTPNCLPARDFIKYVRSELLRSTPKEIQPMELLNGLWLDPQDPPSIEECDFFSLNPILEELFAEADSEEEDGENEEHEEASVIILADGLKI